MTTAQRSTLELSALAENLLHHVSAEDIYELECIFAVRTPDGWVIPEWLQIMYRAAVYRGYL